MALTDEEVLSLKHHLGYGNISVGAFPYTADGFQELFTNVIGPNLIDGHDTSSNTAIVAGSVTTVTVGAIAGIVVRGNLFVDVGDDAEQVQVKAVAGLTFTARFAKAHAASGYPISTVSGVSRLRWLMRQADLVWQKMQDASVTKAAGLQSVDRNRVVWFGGNQVLKDVLSQYEAIVGQISSLVRVRPVWNAATHGSLEYGV